MSTRIDIPSKQLTLAELEQGMDDWARVMVIAGEDGHKILPIYERLEREAEALRSRDAQMAKIYERAKQAKQRSTTPMRSR